MNSQDVPVLIGQSGLVKGNRWNLTQDEIAIGRDGSCQIIVNDKTVSRRHARIFRSEGQWLVEDLSKNGSYLNEMRLIVPESLQDGDVLTISTVAKFVFVGSEATVPLAIEAGQGGRLRLDSESRQVWIGQVELDPPLSLPQYRLIELLYNHSGRVCTRDQIIEVVWPDVQGSAGVSEQSIDALVRRVRDRLAEVDSEHQYLVTIRGHGFRLDNPL